MMKKWKRHRHTPIFMFFFASELYGASYIMACSDRRKGNLV
jgi:hypothetical protein